jgi:glycosyltransferase involved in cell wall biosynthesis
MKMSIIIPTYNEAESIAELIIYLKKNSNAQIIISNGGSTDNTLHIAKQLNPNYTIAISKG